MRYFVKSAVAEVFLQQIKPCHLIQRLHWGTNDQVWGLPGTQMYRLRQDVQAHQALKVELAMHHILLKVHLSQLIQRTLSSKRRLHRQPLSLGNKPCDPNWSHTGLPWCAIALHQCAFTSSPPEDAFSSRSERKWRNLGFALPTQDTSYFQER